MVLKHYFYKLKTVGIRRFYKAVQSRLIADQFVRKKRNTIQFRHSILYPTEKKLFEQSEGSVRLFFKADQYADSIFGYLGAPMQRYSTMPWYEDVRLHQSNKDRFFDAQSLYANIKIPYNSGTYNEEKDIKVPWELARFQYAPVLARAYERTKDKKYAHAIKNYISSWIESSPYLYGIHWVNPMEVAIRAINWIIAWQYMRAELESDVEFYTCFITSLQQHFEYIEHRWEWYDGRTNNHYLSNLVGYAYLCWFFDDTEKWKWCYLEIKNEFSWQIFDEGTSYEGSTAYHGLVTELFIHAFYIALKMKENLDSYIVDKLKRMMIFAHQTAGLTIGDEDGGILCDVDAVDYKAIAAKLGIDITDAKVPSLYSDFGIAFLKKDGWNVSLRLHAYRSRQPSAHFHEDAGSITISYQGTPIVVDPGTYVYSGSHMQRNALRSAFNHTVCYPADWKHVVGDPFFLAMNEGIAQTAVSDDSVATSHNFFGYTSQRIISIRSDRLIINDSVDVRTSWVWRFIFHPDMRLKRAGSSWIICYRDAPLLLFESHDHVFIASHGDYSNHYGIKKENQTLTGTLLFPKSTTQICIRPL